MPLSEQQLAANRANARKSTGPKTPGGKYIASRNGITHGLLAEAVVLPGESPERFHKLIADYIDRFNPATPDEFDLIENMAVNRWRLQRVWSLETAGLIHEQRAQSESTQGQNPPTKYALAHRSLANPPRSLESLSRYETRCDRQYHRAASRLCQLISDREKQEMRIRTQIPEQNEALQENHPPHRTEGRTGVEPGGEPRVEA